MGKKKSTSNSTATYTPMTAPETPLTHSTQALVEQGPDFSSGLIAAYGKGENDIKDQRFEDDLPEFAKKNIIKSDLFRLNTNKAMALGQATGQAHAFKTQGMMNMMNYFKPQYLQTASTGQQTISDPWGAAAGIMGAMGNLASGAAAFCWIAEAIYGVDAPQTHILRAWLTTQFSKTWLGSHVANLYIKHGRTIAKSSKVWLLRPFFDLALVPARKWAGGLR